MSFAGIGSGIAGIFGGIGSEEAAGGYQAAADAYGRAEVIARQNANLTDFSTKIQQAQLSRKIEQTEGAQTASIANAGLEGGGTAGDLMRSSIQQGALANSVVQTQGALNRNGFLQQAEAYEGMKGQAEGAAAAAKTSGFGQIIGGAFSILGAFL